VPTQPDAPRTNARNNGEDLVAPRTARLPADSPSCQDARRPKCRKAECRVLRSCVRRSARQWDSHRDPSAGALRFASTECAGAPCAAPLRPQNQHSAKSQSSRSSRSPGCERLRGRAGDARPGRAADAVRGSTECLRCIGTTLARYIPGFRPQVCGFQRLALVAVG